MNNWKLHLSGYILLILIIITTCSKNSELQSQKKIVSFTDTSVVAIVNNEPIYRYDVDMTLKQLISQLGEKTKYFQSQIKDTIIWKEALSWSISSKLLTQEANNLKIEAKKHEVDNAINSIKRRFSSNENFINALKKNNISYKQFYNDLANELKVQKLLDKKVTSEVDDIYEEKALTYFEAHKEDFIKKPRIRAHHIFIGITDYSNMNGVDQARKKAKHILNKLKTNYNFEKLAKKYSEDPSALKGGDLGFFSKGDMLKEFEDAAFALKVGEISNIIETPRGYHIIRLDEIEEKQYSQFQQVKYEIKELLKKEHSNRLFKEYVNDLKLKANLKVKGEFFSKKLNDD